MKANLSILIFTLFSSSIAFAEHGSKGGNGGGIEICPRAENGYERFQAYDIAEYTGDWGITIVSPELKRNIHVYDLLSTKAQYLANALAKIQGTNAPLADAIRKSLKTLDLKVQDRGQLNLVDDANIVFNRENCNYVQLVNWIDDKEDMRRSGLPEREEYIFRDKRAYENLDPLNQAANDLHEAVYKVKRIFGFELNTGSTYIRRFVAQALSDEPIDAIVYERISPLNRAILEPGAARDYDHAYVSKIYFPYECGASGLLHAQVDFVNTSEDVVTLRGAIFTAFGRWISVPNGNTFTKKFKSKDDYSFPVASYNLFKNAAVDIPVSITIRVYACGTEADIQLPIFHYSSRDGMPDNDALLMLAPNPLFEKSKTDLYK